MWTKPANWEAMPGDDTPEAERDRDWWMKYHLAEVAPRSDEFLFTSGLLAHIPTAQLVKLERIQHRHLYSEFTQKTASIARLNRGDSNECLAWYGTSRCDPKKILGGQHGLDPAESSGGFYGKAVYLSQDPCYQIGGRCE